MRLLLSGGGTGGHIYPGLALLEELQKRDKDLDVLYLGSSDGMEASIVVERGIPFVGMPAQGFVRKFSLDTLKTAWIALLGFFRSYSRVKKYNPDVVVGTGGYVAGPVLLAAALLGKPTVIHEQNALPSLTNRLLSPFVDGVALSFGEAEKFLPKAKSVKVTGNPVRAEFFTLSREDGAKRLNLDPKVKTLISVGGSRGAAPINNAVLEILESLDKELQIQVLLITGRVNYEAALRKIREKGLDLSNRIRVLPYLNDMPAALRAGDLIVARAGGMIAEINACALPAIYIPSPYVADNHQEHNAQAIEAEGAAVMIREKELNPQLLLKTVVAILKDDLGREKMKQAAFKLAKPQAKEDLADLVMAAKNRVN